MRGVQQWFWEAYFVLVLFFAVDKIHLIVQPDSQVNLYFAILKSFDSIYQLSHIAFLTLVILNFIHCIPLGLYIYNVKVGPKIIWKWLFVLRCLFEVLGRSFDVHYYTSIYHSDRSMFTFSILLAIGTLIPSYYACYQYAFAPQKKN